MISDAELAESLKEGNEGAVADLLDRFGSRLLRTALGITGDLQAAEEVVQDAFMQACRGISGLKDTASFKTWLYRIATNLARNRVRGGWLKRVTLFEQGTLELLPATAQDLPENVAVRRERREEVLHCLKQLPVKYREVLVLFYLEELSIREVCSVLGQPEGTVKSKLSRGRTLLKDLLETKGVIL